MHWKNGLFLTFESLTIHLFFLDSVKQCYLQKQQHAVTSSERGIALRGINKTGVEIGERQNRCHDDIYIYIYLYNLNQKLFVLSVIKSTNQFLFQSKDGNLGTIQSITWVDRDVHYRKSDASLKQYSKWVSLGAETLL